jgi:hypothetical protein
MNQMITMIEEVDRDPRVQKLRVKAERAKVMSPMINL